MIKLNSILDHQVMLDRLNKIVTDGIVKDQSRDDVLTEVLGVVIALEHGQEAIEADMESEIPVRWEDIPVHPDSEDDIKPSTVGFKEAI